MQFENGRKETNAVIQELAPQVAQIAAGAFIVYSTKLADKFFTWLETKFS